VEVQTFEPDVPVQCPEQQLPLPVHEAPSGNLLLLFEHIPLVQFRPLWHSPVVWHAAHPATDPQVTVAQIPVQQIPDAH
jgi:hypothetical protein